MIRIVFRSDRGLVLDPARVAPGRGGYLHRSAGCGRSFAARKGVVRSLRVAVTRGQREAFIGRLFAEGEQGR